MRLSDATVTISGLGLMGGSLALALRGKCARIVGNARRAEVREQAARSGIVDHASGDLGEAVSAADIVVLATPVRQVIRSIPEVAAYMRLGALLMDLGSTKRQVVDAMNGIPEGLFAVGGHPMCGKETGGLQNADPELFRDARFVLTPTLRTTAEVMDLAHQVVAAVGAYPLVLDAGRHDHAAAMVSHLPYLLAASLVRTEQEAGTLDKAVDMLAAGGFRDTTRLAASEVEMMVDIMLTNSDAVEQVLDRFEQQLACARRRLRRPDELEQWMADARAHRMEMFS